jgi:hypothetical protein
MLDKPIHESYNVESVKRLPTHLTVRPARLILCRRLSLESSELLVGARLLYYTDSQGQCTFIGPEWEVAHGYP